MTPARLLKTVIKPFAPTPVRGYAYRWLGVGWQGDDLVAWFEGEPGEYVPVQELRAFPTGAYVRNGTHIGSAQRQESDGSFLVMHVYVGPFE